MIGLKHSIHHRGQLSMYLRPMGAKVPSIYGESYDSAKAKESDVSRWRPIAWLAAACRDLRLLEARAASARPRRRRRPPRRAASASAAPGRVVGRVQASGTAVVVLEPKSARTFPPQTDKPVMDQVSLTFGPELLFVRTGQPAEFRNSDDTLHNVNVKHEETREQAFNVAIPTGSNYRLHVRPRRVLPRRLRHPPGDGRVDLRRDDAVHDDGGHRRQLRVRRRAARTVDRDGLHRRQASAQGRRDQGRRDRGDDRVKVDR